MISELFLECCNVAVAAGSPKPLGDSFRHEWRAADVDWALEITGAKTTHETLPAMHALIQRNGFPAGIIAPTSGTVIAGTEDETIDALTAECARLRGARL